MSSATISVFKIIDIVKYTYIIHLVLAFQIPVPGDVTSADEQCSHPVRAILLRRVVAVVVMVTILFAAIIVRIFV